jgi:hypothetical protein
MQIVALSKSDCNPPNPQGQFLDNEKEHGSNRFIDTNRFGTSKSNTKACCDTIHITCQCLATALPPHNPLANKQKLTPPETACCPPGRRQWR